MPGAPTSVESTTSSIWYLFALGSAVFAALTAIFVKLGVKHMDSNLATFIRTVLILVLVGAIVTFTKKWEAPTQMPTRDVVYLVLSAIATGCSWMCYNRAMQLGPASKVAPVDKLSIALTILMSVFILGEHLSWKGWLGGGLVAAGVVIMAFA